MDTFRSEPGCVVAVMEGNNQPSDKTNSTKTVEEETLAPTTRDGQRVALEEPLASGSKNWEDIQKDKWRQSHRPSFPPCGGARTTLWARDVDDEETYNKFHNIHHGRQIPAERRPNGYSEGWDGQKVRQKNVGQYCCAAVVLSRAGVTGYWLRRIAYRVAGGDINGFNRHYGGAIGAAFGFAMLELYDDVAEAKESRLATVASDEYNLNSEKLAEYVFRKYGGEESE